MPTSFLAWLVAELRLSPEEVTALRLEPALDRYVSRLESAVAHGARDPLDVISRCRAGGNSRAARKGLLDGIGYDKHQREAIHRMLADRPDGRPGLFRLFRERRSVTDAERKYLRRQVAIVLYGPEGSRQRRTRRNAGPDRLTAPARRRGTTRGPGA